MKGGLSENYHYLAIYKTGGSLKWYIEYFEVLEGGHKLFLWTCLYIEMFF
jgi:hypothetical protein